MWSKCARFWAKAATAAAWDKYDTSACPALKIYKSNSFIDFTSYTHFLYNSYAFAAAAAAAIVQFILLLIYHTHRTTTSCACACDSSVLGRSVGKACKSLSDGVPNGWEISLNDTNTVYSIEWISEYIFGAYKWINKKMCVKHECVCTRCTITHSFLVPYSSIALTHTHTPHIYSERNENAFGLCEWCATDDVENVLFSGIGMRMIRIYHSRWVRPIHHCLTIVDVIVYDYLSTLFRPLRTGVRFFHLTDEINWKPYWFHWNSLTEFGKFRLGCYQIIDFVFQFTIWNQIANVLCQWTCMRAQHIRMPSIFIAERMLIPPKARRKITLWWKMLN